ncbi:MAG: diguanylate cyclase, partial [Pseudomonadota bacterium]
MPPPLSCGLLIIEYPASVATGSITTDTAAPIIALVADLTSDTAQHLATSPMVAEVLAVDEINSPRFLFTVQRYLGQYRPGTSAAMDVVRLENENKSLSALNEIAKGLMDRMQLPDLLQRIAETVIELAESDASFISMLNESETYLNMVASAGGFEQLKGFKHRRGEGIAGSAWAQKKLIYADNYEPNTSHMNQFAWIAEACAVPIMIDDRVRGVIGITYKDKNSPLKEKLHLIEEFSQLAALAIENTTLTQITELELKRTETIRQLSQLIYTSTDFDTLFDQIADSLFEVLNLQRVQLSQWNDKKHTLSCIRQWEYEPERIVKTDNPTVQQWSHELASWAIHSRQSLKVDKLQLSKHHNAGFGDNTDQPDIGATIVLPVVHDTVHWGAMLLQRRPEQRDFNQNDLNLIDVLGNQLSTTIHRHGLLEQVQHQAFHDSLTNLPNRFKFESILQEYIEQQPSQTSVNAIIFLDLDGFKKINDTLGHATGDQLLVAAAKRLSQQIKHTDTLARMGGDEFAVLLKQVNTPTSATSIATRLITSLNGDFTINNTKLNIGASAGLSFITGKTIAAHEIFKNADIAMYQAKEAGKNRVHCFSQTLAKRYQKRVQLEQDLHTALTENQFELYYQPQVNTATQKVDGVEALIRWNHPTRGTVPPFEFISAAEDFGQISQIGDWVIVQACTQMSRWIARGGRALSVAVNISADHFRQKGFVEFVLETLKNTGLAPNLLHLEVTESVVMNDVGNIVNTLQQLRSHGIS